MSVIEWNGAQKNTLLTMMMEHEKDNLKLWDNTTLFFFFLNSQLTMEAKSPLP